MERIKTPTQQANFNGGRSVQLFTNTLTVNGSKPQIWFVGDEQYDPILMAFETQYCTTCEVAGQAGEKGIVIYQYNNLVKMQTNQI